MINKQEVIEKIEACKSPFISEDDTIFNYGLDKALSIIKQLDEPEKPVVPQYVADWYEEHKEDLEYNLYRLCINFNERKLYGDLYEWFKFDKNKPIETLILMHKFGYEIEKEKLYRAKLKLTNEYLHYDKNYKEIRHYKTSDDVANKVKAYHFIEDDLVKYHIWGNESYEVKEVKE